MQMPVLGQTIHQLAAGKVLLELKDGMSCVHSVVGDIDEERRSELLGEWVRKEGIRVGLNMGLRVSGRVLWLAKLFLLFSVSRQQPSSASNPLSASIPHPVSEQQQQPAAGELSIPFGPFTGADPAAMFEAFTSVLANKRCLVAAPDSSTPSLQEGYEPFAPGMYTFCNLRL